MSHSELQAAAYACLAQIQDPCSVASVSPMNLVEMGLVREVRQVGDGEVHVDLRLTSPSCFMIAHMTKEARRLIGELPGVTAVEVHADSGLDWSPEDIHPAAAARRRRLLLARPTAPSAGSV